MWFKSCLARFATTAPGVQTGTAGPRSLQFTPVADTSLLALGSVKRQAGDRCAEKIFSPVTVIADKSHAEEGRASTHGPLALARRKIKTDQTGQIPGVETSPSQGHGSPGFVAFKDLSLGELRKFIRRGVEQAEQAGIIQGAD